MKNASVKILVPATSANLGPGFDVLGVALDFYNTVEISLQPGLDIRAETAGEGARFLSRRGSKMVVEAVRRVFQRAGSAAPGLLIRQYNKIPLFRGLGSSAAAVAGGMAAANALLPEPLPPEEIFCLAAAMEGHPDNVAPALFGGFTVACATKNGYRHIRIDPPAGLNVVVCVPSFTLPTKKSRSLLPEHVPLDDAVFNIGHTALLVAALFTGNLKHLSFAMEDKLHQPYRSLLIPGLAAVKEAAREAGALAAVLSGAGPALISFTCGQEDAVGEAMRQTFAAYGVTARIIVAGIGHKGALDCVYQGV